MSASRSHSLADGESATAPHLASAGGLAPRESGLADYLGAFAVTAGLGVEKLAGQSENSGDDYRALLAKTLADRLAEAFAEKLHQLVRRKIWGYAAGEKLDFGGLLRQKYIGIRPAPGYPTCPDHSEKRGLFALLDAERNTGITLTETFAMKPAASVCGWYFAHPQAEYFNLGKIGRDQVNDYARRKNMELSEVEHWLAPYLAYKK